MRAHDEPRRPSLATIVGSSLAVAAAGSLLAFSTLAEQAGLQGLTAVGIQPAEPRGGGGGGKAITLPAPATNPPADPRDDLAELVRQTIARDAEVPPAERRPVIAFQPAPRPKTKPERPEPIEATARVAVAPPAEENEVATTEPDGPPYGHAYGHHKNKDHHKPKPAKKHAPKGGGEQPVYARTTGDAEPGRGPKPPKLEKAPKAKGNDNGKAKGHSKHAHGKGKAKGKGHSKHGG